MENIPGSFILKVAQIKAIYEAGMERGSNEATAYEWGSSASGSKYDELETVLIWDKETWLEDALFALEYDEKIDFWNKFKEELYGK